MKMRMMQLSDFMNFFNQIKDVKTPIRLAYKLNKLSTQVASELDFYQKKFAEIIYEFGKRDADGNFVYSADGLSIEIADGKQTECQKRVEELQNLEVDLPDVHFSLDELEVFNLSLSEMDCLMPFIEE